MAGNLHTHSSLSDGHRSPEEVCRFYETAGYDFLALTEHFLEHYGWPLVDTRPFRSATFTTLLGAELHPAQDLMELGRHWHILAIGLPLDFAPSPLEETGPELARRALDAGAFVVAAHPQWHAMTDRDVTALGSIHAIEIFNACCRSATSSSGSPSQSQDHPQRPPGWGLLGQELAHRGHPPPRIALRAPAKAACPFQPLDVQPVAAQPLAQPLPGEHRWGRRP